MSPMVEDVKNMSTVKRSVDCLGEVVVVDV